MWPGGEDSGKLGPYSPYPISPQSLYGDCDPLSWGSLGPLAPLLLPLTSGSGKRAAQGCLDHLAVPEQSLTYVCLDGACLGRGG